MSLNSSENTSAILDWRLAAAPVRIGVSRTTRAPGRGNRSARLIPKLSHASQIDLVARGLHGRNGRLRNVDAQVPFGFREGDPQVSPRTGLPHGREYSGHVRRRVAFDQRVRVALACG